MHFYSSGPPVGGLGVGANPYQYSSTFFGHNVKDSMIPTNFFGSKKSVRKVSRKAVKRFSKKVSKKAKKSGKKTKKSVKKWQK